MLEMTDGDKVLRFWVASLVEEVCGREGDWLCVLIRRARGAVEAHYRFRYHGGPGFDDGDESSWWSVKSAEGATPDPEGLSASVRVLLKSPGFARPHEGEVPSGTVKAMFAQIMELPGWKVRIWEDGSTPP